MVTAVGSLGNNNQSGNAHSVWIGMIAECGWFFVNGLGPDLFLLIVTALACLFTACSLSWWRTKWRSGKLERPNASGECKLRFAPGPAPWPIVGNLLQLQRNPHRCLARMAEKYGELMTVHMGPVPILVVSSPAAAKEILVSQGTTFASRPLFPSSDAISLGGRDLVFAPYSAFWRKHRKIAGVHMFSPKRMSQVEAIRPTFIDCLEEELLMKAKGAHTKGRGPMGRNEKRNAWAPTALQTNASCSNPDIRKMDATANVETSNAGRVQDGQSCRPDGNEQDSGSDTMDALEPVHVQESVLRFVLDTLTYLIFGWPVSPGMHRHLAKCLATDGRSRGSVMTSGVQQDGVEEATRKMDETSLQTKGRDALDDDDGDHHQVLKRFREVILEFEEVVEEASMAPIADLIPSLRFLFRGYFSYVRGLPLRLQSLIPQLVEKRREYLRKFVIDDRGTVGEGQSAERVVGIVNPNAVMDAVFDNLSPLGTGVAGNLDDHVQYGKPEACLLFQSLIGAGTDTTTSVITFLLMELLRHPDKMVKLNAEIDEAIIIGMHKVPSDNALENLPYLNAVLYETLRMHGPTPLLVPRQSIEDTVVFGYDVPAGTRVMVNAWAIMHDPKVWSDPWEFRPERFIRDGRLADAVHPDGKHFGFLPFGSGRRVCPGMRFGLNMVRSVVFRLLQRFDLMLPSGMKPEDVDVTERPGLVIFPKTPVAVIFRPRQVT